MNKNNLDMLKEFEMNLGFKVERKNISQNTLISYTTGAKQFIEYLGDKDLNKATENNGLMWLNSFTSKDGSKAKSATRNQRITGLNAFYNFMIGEEYATRNPFSNIAAERIKIKGSGKNQDTKEILEKSEIANLVKILDKKTRSIKRVNGQSLEETKVLAYRNKAFINMMLATGMRVQELCKLKIKDIDTTKYTTHVMMTVIEENSKGKVARTIPVERKYFDYVLEYYEVAKLDITSQNDLLFRSRSNKPLATNSINKMIKGYCEDAGITKNISSHSFRHTYGTNMANTINNNQKVAQLMGHKTTKLIEERYWHATKEDELVTFNF